MSVVSTLVVCVVDPVAKVTGVYLMFLNLIDVLSRCGLSSLSPGLYAMHGIHASHLCITENCSFTNICGHCKEEQQN